MNSGIAHSILADIRYAARTLRQSPAFVAVAVLSIALGVGANTAVFTLVDQVLLRQLPVTRPHALVHCRSELSPLVPSMNGRWHTRKLDTVLHGDFGLTAVSQE